MNIERIRNLIRAFYPYAKQQLGFTEPLAKVRYITNDINNAENPFGKTAYYNPEEKSVTLFILNRHPKDILRSFAHELTHHAQHCRGDFDGQDVSTEEGYAQKDPLLRRAEKEAYEKSILVRDWTDTMEPSEKERIINLMENKENEHKEVKQTRKRLDDDQAVTDMFEERRNKLNKKLMDKFIKPVKKEGNTE